MYEVELKVPADLESVRNRLVDLEADGRGTVVQRDTYYDAPHRSFPETDEALRIRREHPADGGTVDERDGGAVDEKDETRVTYKGPLLDEASKTRAEVETGVEDDEAFDAILTNLGFEAVATVEKRRERFGLDDYAITLDAVEGVGEFVEVETEADGDDDGELPDSDLEAARAGARAVLERLGLDPDKQIRTSYLELLLGR